jgi:3-dehydroquinate synthetase
MSASAAAALPEAPTVIPVPLGRRAYDILVGRGLLEEAAPRIAPLKCRAAAIVSDETVAPLYAERLAAGLAAQGIRTETVTVPAGEASKSYAGLASVCDAILAARIERGDLVDRARRRGGGRSRRVCGRGPAPRRAPRADPDDPAGAGRFLGRRQDRDQLAPWQEPGRRLPPAEPRARRHGAPRHAAAARDAGRLRRGGEVRAARRPRLLRLVRGKLRAVFAGGPERDHAVAESCRAKAAVVVRDEREDGRARPPNLGHTFAHALERATNYDAARLVHGEAVAIGLALAFRFSARLGLCPGQDAGRVAAHLATVGLPMRLADISGGCGPVDGLVEAMAQDKKVKGGELTFILVRGIGESFVARGVAADAVRGFLEDERGA